MANDLSIEMTRLIGVLKDESDRGVALAGAAYLDQCLKDLLIAFFVSEPDVVNRAIASKIYSSLERLTSNINATRRCSHKSSSIRLKM